MRKSREMCYIVVYFDFIIHMAKAALLDYCQAQGPTPCPTQGEGQGQVNSKFGPNTRHHL